MRSPFDISRELTSFAAGAVLGVAAMYLLDPDRGKRRRGLVADKAYSVVAGTRSALGAASRDAAHRIEGLRARARRLLSDAPVPDDLQLIERVRARMGRLVSHPHAIQVGANHGRVTLSGPVLAQEAPRLLSAVRTVWGVSAVEDRLVLHATAQSISSLQGGAPDNGDDVPFVRERWTPAIQAGAVVGGALLTMAGLRERPLVAATLAGAGLALILRGATNQPIATLVAWRDATIPGMPSPHGDARIPGDPGTAMATSEPA